MIALPGRLFRSVTRVFADQVTLIRLLAPAGFTLVLGMFALLVARALAPAGTAFLLGQVIASVSGRDASAWASTAVLPLGFLGAAIFASHTADVLFSPLAAAAAARIDGTHRISVARRFADHGSLHDVERSDVQQLLRQVSADPTKGFEATPSSGAIAALRSLAGFFGAIGAIVLLVQFSWVLVPLVFVPILLNRMIQVRFAFGISARWRGASDLELPVDVWRRATISPAEAKDIRIFGLVDWIDARMKRDLLIANEPLWSYFLKMVRGQWAQLALVLAALIPTYLLVALSARSGFSEISVATAVVAAGWSVFSVFPSPWDRVEMVNSVELEKATQNLNGILRRSDHIESSSVQTRSTPSIVFDNVSFQYDSSSPMVLRGLDFEVRPGELLGMVGLNGAGKSTVMKLLGGLYTPTEGRILIDGVDLASMDLGAWRRQVSIVFQDFTKYNLTLLENVAMSRGDIPPDRAKADRAAINSGLDAVIPRLAHGWDTILSRSRDGGTDLSGGQWQQVILTRALYAADSGASVLALDEPTAHLDVRTEFETFDRLARYRDDKSIILISHRLSTVRQSDRIVLLEGGRVRECGTHDELMAEKGRYATMFNIQASRFSESS